MIGKITTGAEFTGLIDYLLDPTKTPQILTTNLNGTSRNQLLSELEYCAAQRPTTKKPVKHLMIAFAPTDGKIDDPTAEEIALTSIKKLGYANNQYLIVRHGRIDPNHDRNHDHDHVHILVNAIDFDGERVSDSHELYKLKDILQELEVQYDLTRTISFDQRKYKGSTTGQIQRMMREIDGHQKEKGQKAHSSLHD